MKPDELIGPSVLLIPPPPGSVIRRRGHPVEGPGGRWIPCVIQSPGGPYLASVFRVGRGCRQVCSDRPMHSPDEALALARDLAAIAAG